MEQKNIKFTNSKNNSNMQTFLTALLAIIAVELIIAVIIVFVLINELSSRIIVTAVLLLLEAYVIYTVLALRNSAHKINNNGLLLQLGTFRLCLPWQIIFALEPVSTIALPSADTVGRILLRQKNTLFCLCDNQNIFKLHLKEPLEVKAKDAANPQNKQGLVDAIYFNVDNYHEFDEIVAAYAPISKPLNQTRASTENTYLQPKVFTPITDRSPLLQLEQVSYDYGQAKAVSDLDLKVYPGECVAFLGSNGAGKSTTLNMITGLLPAQTGQILLQGHNISKEKNRQYRRQIGFVPDQPILYSRLTTREHLQYSGKLYGLNDQEIADFAQYWLKFFELSERQNQPIDSYSQGMQRKVSLIIALLSNPDLLIIDELTNAFDTQTLAKIKQLFISRTSEGKSILFSGHVMAFAESIADRIIIIRQGRIVACGNLPELLTAYQAIDLEQLFLSLNGR